jgi:hypothetical protein
LNAVIAGSGVRVKECRESIELLARLRARRLDRMLIASGTVEKRFEERSNDVSDPASGANADVVMDIKLFSARHKWRKKRHLIEGRVPMDVMSELEPWWGRTVDVEEEWLPPDPERFILDERWWVFVLDPFLELDGLAGELLLGRELSLEEADGPLDIGWLAGALPLRVGGCSALGDGGAEEDSVRSFG